MELAQTLLVCCVWLDRTSLLTGLSAFQFKAVQLGHVSGLIFTAVVQLTNFYHRSAHCTTSSQSLCILAYDFSQMLISRYRLGEGSFGSVFSVTERRTGYMYAAKQIKPERLGLGPYSLMAKREIRMMMNINHVSLRRSTVSFVGLNEFVTSSQTLFSFMSGLITVVSSVSKQQCCSDADTDETLPDVIMEYARFRDVRDLITDRVGMSKHLNY